jgi:hypothetical protein
MNDDQHADRTGDAEKHHAHHPCGCHQHGGDGNDCSGQHECGCHEHAGTHYCCQHTASPSATRCPCACHRDLNVRVSVSCDCGKGTGNPPGPCCPPPRTPTPPGTVDLPQPPPPHPQTSDVPPWKQGRPPVGSPPEIPWFTGKIGETGRNGPTFGPRKDEFLPYLLVRANSTDRGARPFSGVFWESPDIYVVPDQPADTAPLRPAGQGGTARASAPNTLYAHVWNLGKAPAFRVRVEFWWFDPSLGFSRSAGHLIGAAYLDLEDRFTLYPDWREVTEAYGTWLSRGAHAVVKCPATWIPEFLNNGHECLVVRAGDAMLDPVAVQSFSPAADRHVGQRNIAVVPAASPAQVTVDLNLGWHATPGEADIDVVLEAPGTMEWLQLYKDNRNTGLRAPSGPVSAGLLNPVPVSVRPPDLGMLPPDERAKLLRQHERFHRGCDQLHIALHAFIADIGRDEAQVIRVRQRIDGELVGGYTVVLVGHR